MSRLIHSVQCGKILCKGRHLLIFYMNKLQCVSEPECSSLPNLYPYDTSTTDFKHKERYARTPLWRHLRRTLDFLWCIACKYNNNGVWQFTMAKCVGLSDMSLTKDRIIVWEFMSQLYYNLTILNTSYNWQILEYEYNVYIWVVSY